MNRLTLNDIGRVDNDAVVLAVGQAPESLNDLLVVGEESRDVFLPRLREAIGDTAMTAMLLDDALLITRDTRSQQGIAYQSREEFFRRVERLKSGVDIDGISKPWSIGPWLPEAYASDLARAVCVIGNGSDVDDQARDFLTYPHDLRCALMELMSTEVDIKSSMIANGVESKLAKQALEVDVALASIRLIYAQERVYFRGLKYVGQTLPVLSDCAAEAVFRIAYGDGGMV